MASRQAKEERAEAAARLAVSDLKDINKERQQETTVTGVDVTVEHPPQQQQGPGMFGSMLRAVHDTYEHAKEVVVGKSQDAATATKETADSAADKTRGAYDTAAGKTQVRVVVFLYMKLFKSF